MCERSGSLSLRCWEKRLPLKYRKMRNLILFRKANKLPEEVGMSLVLPVRQWKRSWGEASFQIKIFWTSQVKMKY